MKTIEQSLCDRSKDKFSKGLRTKLATLDKSLRKVVATLTKKLAIDGPFLFSTYMGGQYITLTWEMDVFIGGATNTTKVIACLPINANSLPADAKRNLRAAE